MTLNLERMVKRKLISLSGDFNTNVNIDTLSVLTLLFHEERFPATFISNVKINVETLKSIPLTLRFPSFRSSNTVCFLIRVTQSLVMWGYTLLH